MRTFIPLLLLVLSTRTFAQQNELVLAPGLVGYKAFYHTTNKKTGHAPDISGNGYQLALMFLHNINWLQVGGSVEFGKLNTAQVYNYAPAQRHTLGDPYVIFNARVGGRLPVKQWTFSGGACAGYFIGSARDSYLFTGWEEIRNILLLASTKADNLARPTM